MIYDALIKKVEIIQLKGSIYDDARFSASIVAHNGLCPVTSFGVALYIAPRLRVTRERTYIYSCVCVSVALRCTLRTGMTRKRITKTSFSSSLFTKRHFVRDLKRKQLYINIYFSVISRQKNHFLIKYKSVDALKME